MAEKLVLVAFQLTVAAVNLRCARLPQKYLNLTLAISLMPQAQLYFKLSCKPCMKLLSNPALLYSFLTRLSTRPSSVLSKQDLTNMYMYRCAYTHGFTRIHACMSMHRASTSPAKGSEFNLSRGPPRASARTPLSS